MNKDGLTATNEKVWDWSDFRRMALRHYGFFGVGKSFPFADNSNKEQLIYDGADAELAFFIYMQRAIVEEIQQLVGDKHVFTVQALAVFVTLRCATEFVKNQPRFQRKKDCILQSFLSAYFQLSAFSAK